MQGYKLKAEIKDIKVGLSSVKRGIKDMNIRIYLNVFI